VADDPNVTTTGDIALVRAAQHGDTIALADLLDRLAPYVGRICGAIALDSGPDATQATLGIVMGSVRDLRNPAALHGWVRAIAVREAVRLAQRDARTVATDIDSLTRLPAPDDPQLAVDVRAVLERLSPEHRAVLVIRDLHGHDEATAAAMLDLPAGTIKSRLHRARQTFRKEWTS
jgi:DNA-directed RNA polymerase specialized sigma24 family protein